MDKLKTAMPSMPDIKMPSMPSMPEVKMPSMPEVKMPSMPDIDFPPIGANDLLNNPATQTIAKFSEDILIGFIVLFILCCI